MINDSIVDILTFEQFKNAYRKTKSIAYFDKTQVNLKKLFSEFENTDNLDQKITELYNNVIERLSSNVPNVELRIVPKNTSLYKSKSEIVYNNNDSKIYIDYKEDMQVFIDIDLADHIIGMLWTMTIGKEIDKQFGNHVYGNRIKNSHVNNVEMETSPYLMKPYFEQYQSWQNNAFDVAQNHFRQKEDLVFINLDLKRFYYNIDFNVHFQEKIYTLKNSIYNIFHSFSLNEYVFKTIINYSEKLKELNLIDENYTVLPIGYMPSSILSNYYLMHFDEIVNKSNPIYYGRYVDDIIIIFKNNSDINKKTTLNSILNNYIKEFENNHSTKINKVVFKSEDYELIFNEKKSKIFIFDHKGVTKNLDSFKKHINKNSSEFRMIPDIEDALGIDQVFDFESSESHKLSSSLNSKLSKYEFSKYIGKLLQVLKSTNNIEQTIYSDLMDVLSEANLIDIHLSWEQLFSIFCLSKKNSELDLLINKIINAINNIEVTSIKENQKVEKTNINILDITSNNIKHSLLDSLHISLSRALTLVSNDFYENIKSLPAKELELIIGTRYNMFVSGMVNSNYLGINSLFLSNTNQYNYNYTEHTNIIDNLIEYSIFKQWVDNKNSYYYRLPYNVSLIEIRMVDLYMKIRDEYSGDSILLNEVSNIYNSWKFINGYSNDQESKINYIEHKVEKEQHKAVKEIITYNEYIIKDNSIISRLDNLNKPFIGVGNVSSHIPEKKYYKHIRDGLKNNSIERYTNFTEAINTAIRFKSNNNTRVDLFVLPEVFIPIEWIQVLTNISKKNDLAIISGVEHIKHKDKYFNFVASVFPVNMGEYRLVDVNFHLKVHYSPDEKKNFLNKTISGNSYKMFKWRGLNITPYCCYELTSVEDRIIFKDDEVNIIAAIVYNKDLQYFSNIVESLSRDLNTIVIQANDAKYGDSRIFQPTKGHSKDLLKIKGGLNYTSLISQVDITGLKDHLRDPWNIQAENPVWKSKYPTKE